MVLGFHLPFHFVLFVLCGSWDVATRGTKTQPLCPDCIYMSKETKEKVSHEVRGKWHKRNCQSTRTRALIFIHRKATSCTSCTAYREWVEEKHHLSYSKVTIFSPADRLMKHRMSTSRAVIQPKPIRLPTHPFSAYMNGAAQYLSYLTLMVSTLQLLPVMTPGRRDITGSSCPPQMTKHCLIITLPAADSDRRQSSLLTFSSITITSRVWPTFHLHLRKYASRS